MKALLVTLLGTAVVVAAMVLTPFFLLAPRKPPAAHPVDPNVYSIQEGGGTSTIEPNHIRVIPIIRKGPQLQAKTDTAPPEQTSPPLAPEKPKPEIAKPVEDDTADDETVPRYQRRLGRQRGNDICARTGGVKVVTGNGRSWHCRYR
jgi:hypothetical protein